MRGPSISTLVMALWLEERSKLNVITNQVSNADCMPNSSETFTLLLLHEMACALFALDPRLLRVANFLSSRSILPGP